jgi:hypothetical protein
MTFAIHAAKDGQSVLTIRIGPAAAVDKARLLESLGWQVHITDAAGQQFGASDFDRLLWINQEIARRDCNHSGGVVHGHDTN